MFIASTNRQHDIVSLTSTLGFVKAALSKPTVPMYTRWVRGGNLRLVTRTGRAKVASGGSLLSARRLALMLFNRRKRIRELEEAEARGESFWTSAFNRKVRTRLTHAATGASGPAMQAVVESARLLILSDEGLHYLMKPELHPAEDFSLYFFNAPDDTMPTVIESLFVAMSGLASGGFHFGVNPWDFVNSAQEILAEERIAYDFANGQMVPFESKEMHQAVVEPALQLLHNPKFAKAEKPYRQALDELSKGTPGDAITDAGTALQETLTALGCDGNSLGPLIKSAKAKGLLAAHDVRMTQAIEDVMEWVAADRSAKGDSHKADESEKEDAWFTIHVVGAVIVRLVSARRR